MSPRTLLSTNELRAVLRAIAEAEVEIALRGPASWTSDDRAALARARVKILETLARREETS